MAQVLWSCRSCEKLRVAVNAPRSAATERDAVSGRDNRCSIAVFPQELEFVRPSRDWWETTNQPEEVILPKVYLKADILHKSVQWVTVQDINFNWIRTCKRFKLHLQELLATWYVILFYFRQNLWWSFPAWDSFSSVNGLFFNAKL